MEWTLDQQVALETALRSIDKTTDDRWKKIAEAVPGKTMKDCVRRYKQIKERILEKKRSAERNS